MQPPEASGPGGLGYPLHHGDYFLEFVLGMWFNTRESHGKPTPREVELTLPNWPAARRAQLIEALGRNEQLAFPSVDLKVAA